MLIAQVTIEEKYIFFALEKRSVRKSGRKTTNDRTSTARKSASDVVTDECDEVVSITFDKRVEQFHADLQMGRVLSETKSGLGDPLSFGRRVLLTSDLVTTSLDP